MNPGLWLLTNYSDNKQRIMMLDDRKRQYEKARGDVNELIESLALRNGQMDAPASQGGFSDPTSKIALTYEELLEMQKQDIELKIEKIKIDTLLIQNYIYVSDIIVSGLPDNDRWFVEQYFFNKESIPTRSAKDFPDGNQYSKTFYYKMKNRIVDEVTQACILLRFTLIEFPE